MPFNTPLAHFVGPYTSLPRPPVGTALYDLVYNDDLASIKVQLINRLNMNCLPNMPMGFPFRVFDDGRGVPYVSRESYEFEEQFCLSDHGARTASVKFSYTAPANEGEQLLWRITVPTRESVLNGNIPSRSLIAQVTVDRGVMELPYGFRFMTEPTILLQHLARSIELGILITINVAKISMLHPTDRNLNYNPGDIIFVATDNDNGSQVVHVVKLQA